MARRLQPPRLVRARPAAYARHARLSARGCSRHAGRGGRGWLVLLIVVLPLAGVVGLLGSGVALWSHGYRVYVVHTGSMEPTYRPGDVIIDAPVTGGYRPGQVITFRHSDLTTDVVTHRVVGVSAAGITTKGDANATADAWTIRPGQVRGRTVAGVTRLGYVMVYLHQPSGLLSVLTAAASILLLWGICFPSTEPERQPDPGLPQAVSSTVELLF